MKNTNKLGMMINPDRNYTMEQNAALLKSVGFDATFISWKYEMEDTKALVSAITKNGITVDSMHAPFLGGNCIWKKGPNGDGFIDMLMKCCDDAAENGIDKVVFHPITGESFPQSSRIGIDRFRRLIDHANSKGVKPCFENVEYTEMLGIVMHEFGNDVGFCYDTGHESTNDPGIHFLKLFGDRLRCTHIHDNYGLSYLVTPILHGDCHMLPLDASIDFKRVMSDIRSCDYKGVLMIEASRRGDIGTYTDYSLAQFYERAYNALCEIAEY